MVRGKFKVTGITQHNYDGKTIKLSAIYDQSIPEDQKFSVATPTGSVEMFVTNPKAIEQFVIGKAYYVDFTPAQATE